ncbi:MAG: hypothetical protein HYS34_06655 [Acidobacteria bacterium]|nr:hypothetical protein [Acidobacteriota bacterium]
MRSVLYGPAILACGALLVCGALLACGGGGGPIGPPPGPVASFRCLDSAPATDHVVLRCAEQVAPDEWRIDVIVGVPTISSVIRGFNFDLVFNPLLLEFVPGSEEQGNLLGRDGEFVLLSARTATNPDGPGRLIVGISRTGRTGIDGVPDYDRIMSFRIRALTMTPFGPEAPAFENWEAFDSSDQAILEIVFRDQLLLSVE